MQEGFYRTAATLIAGHEVREDPPPTQDISGARKGFQTFCLRFQHLSHALPRCRGVRG
jgi:hypothetical protein